VASDQLFRQLCTPEVLKIGWHLAQSDSRDDFVLDPVGYADFASNLDERLEYLRQEVANHRYRPRHLLDIDIPKTGLSVRPGNVLPIEERVLLHAITYLLAQKCDAALSDSVYSFRLHKDWLKRVKRGQSLFREAENEIPFLKNKTIRKIDPIEPWYTAWPDFDAQTTRAFTELGFTHLTKTDITAYFENIDLRILEAQVRALLRRDEDVIVQTLFRILDGWTRITSTGTPVGRGIPQGDDVSSFLGNLYLIPLDRALNAFCRSVGGMWCRYVDDVKVMTTNEKDARKAVFVINDALRRLHLNLQGSKTKLLQGEELDAEIYDPDGKVVNAVVERVQRLHHHKPADRKIASAQLKALVPFASRFRRNSGRDVRDLTARENRLFRRLMTVYGMCKRPHLIAPAVEALRELPELRVLQKSLRYLSQQEYDRHDGITEALLSLVKQDQLLFPYQIGKVFETLKFLHPSTPKAVASLVRQLGLSKRRHWYIRLKAAEALITLPYRDDWIDGISTSLMADDHPWVRRAGCAMLTRAPLKSVRATLKRLIYHADVAVSRLAQFWHRHIEDKVFALQQLARLAAGQRSDTSFIYSIPVLYVLRCNPDQLVVKSLREHLKSHSKTKSSKILWHIDTLLALTEWAEHPQATPQKTTTTQGKGKAA
jgi:hypothetical protein